jgi:hypothetical protein
MKRWAGLSSDQLECKLEEYYADWNEHEQTVRIAIRNGLAAHPTVIFWLEARRSLGDWLELRRLRLGLECGVSTVSRADFWVIFASNEWIWQGVKLEDIGLDIEPETVSKRRKQPEKLRSGLVAALNRTLGSPDALKAFEETFGLTPAEVKALRDKVRGMARQNFHRWLRRLSLG